MVARYRLGELDKGADDRDAEQLELDLEETDERLTIICKAIVAVNEQEAVVKKLEGELRKAKSKLKDLKRKQSESAWLELQKRKS